MRPGRWRGGSLVHHIGHGFANATGEVLPIFAETDGAAGLRRDAVIPGSAVDARPPSQADPLGVARVTGH
jgi:hypothetical protein